MICPTFWQFLLKFPLSLDFCLKSVLLLYLFQFLVCNRYIASLHLGLLPPMWLLSKLRTSLKACLCTTINYKARSNLGLLLQCYCCQTHLFQAFCVTFFGPQSHCAKILDKGMPSGRTTFWAASFHSLAYYIQTSCLWPAALGQLWKLFENFLWSSFFFFGSFNSRARSSSS